MLQQVARLVDLALARGFGEQVELQGAAVDGHAGARWSEGFRVPCRGLEVPPPCQRHSDGAYRMGKVPATRLFKPLL